MSNTCSICSNWSTFDIKEGDHKCNLLHVYTRPVGMCPGFRCASMTEEEIKAQQEKADALRNNVLAKAGHPQVESNISAAEQKPAVKKHNKIETKEREEQNQVTLFEHQKLAREKFRDLDEIALFFEMGCGKSLTSISIIADKFNDGAIDSLLIVAPNDVHKQWFDDLCDDNSVLSKLLIDEHIECTGQIIGGRYGQKAFYEFDDNDDRLHIVCCNIDTFSTPHKWEPVVEWANSHNTAIIMDEATVIKNPTAKRSQRMLFGFNNITKRGRTIVKSEKINPVRIVLTGTPVTNGPMDLWSIMEFVKPNYFGRNYYSFMNYYGMHTKMTVQDRQINVLLNEGTWRGIKNCDDYATAYDIFGCSEDTYMTVKHQDKYLGPYKHADELRALLEPVSVFAKLTDCVDMPACNYIVKKIPLSPEQEACYNNMKRDLLAQYDEHITTAKNKMVSIIRLQQIASGFIVGHTETISEDAPLWADEEYDIGPDEVIWLGNTNPRIEQLMRDIDELDKPILIITRFSAEAAKIFDLLKDKYSTCLITGWKTVGSIDDFKNGKYDIMVANISRIARGHNLQISHTTLFYSSTFSMELRQQTEFRTFRIGQKYPCTYIDYESCEADRTIRNALAMKKGLLDYMRDRDITELI